jgi:serine/threonine protein kinase
MTIQCPACLSDNSDNSNNCRVCGYPIDNQTKSSPTNLGIYLRNGVFLKKATYRIDKFLGEGGFGITYQGLFVNKNIPIAIKEFWPEKAARQNSLIIWPNKISLKERQEQIKKFKLEAEIQKECVHLNIPKIYDFFEENNTAYIIMEYIEGETLYSLLKKQKKFTEATLLPYILQIIDALKIVHKHNFLHRDIKPDNVIVNPSSQQISLIDFGSTKEFLAGQTGDMTRVLTPGYAPPEQYIYSAKRHKATDIYALCASIYELLTNQLPIESLERLNAISHQLPDPLIPPRQIVPEISPKIEKIILTGMKIKVEERFQNVDQLLTALQGKFISPLHQQAQQLVKQNKLNEAIKLYQKCLQQEPDNGEAAVELALIQIHFNPTQAEKDAENALKLKPEDGRIYGLLGLIKCRQNKWSEAIIFLKKAAHLAPQQPWIQANLAWSLAKSEYWTEAEQSVNQALKLNNNCVFSLGLQGWIKSKQQDYKSALRYSTQAIFTCKNSLSLSSQEMQKWIYPHLIYALKQAVASQEARDIERRIEEFISQLPNNSYAWGLKAWQESKQNNWQVALLTFEKAFHCDNQSYWALINQAIILEYLNHIPEAMTIYQKVSDQFPDNALSWFRLGTLVASIYNEWKEAKTYLQQALSINPQYPEAYHNLAWVLLNIEDDNTSQEVIFNYQQAVYYYEQQNKAHFAQMIRQKFKNIGFNL